MSESISSHGSLFVTNEARIANVLSEYQRLVDKAEFDFMGRAVVNIIR